MKQVHINGLLQNGYYADGNTTVVAFRPGSIVAVLVITFNALPDPLVVVLNNGGTDALADVIGQELVSLLTAGLSIQNAAVELSDVVIEEATTTVETTIGTTTKATGPAMPETTPESTPDTTPGTSPETSPETSPATSPVTPPITTPETTAASTTPELTCADDEFACDEGRCIDESAVCDFIPDCRVSRNDETEDLCEVSLLTDDISVTSRRNATLTIPDSYPSRTQDTPLDYILYRLTSPDNSYLLIDVVSLQSNGPDSIVTIGNGHDPVEANYLPDGIFQRSGINSAFPSTYYTPDNEAFVLLGRAAEEDVEMDIRISVFQCPQEDAVPCLRSSQCYLPSQICDNETHCQNGEDEQNCPNECVSCTTLWGGDIPVCLPLDWLCDGYQDCDDNLDESDCPTCFECPSGSSYDCVYDPEWVCDTYEDCNEGEDERNCPVFCPDGQFGCPWPDSVCIDETLICDFVPDCRVAGGDEAEEVCMVSQITDEIMVPFNEYKILRNPDSYPTRDVNTSSDYQLYKISSPPDSHLLIEIIRVVFDGTQSTVSVGSGLDPIEAFYDNGIVLAYTNGSGYVANPNPVYQTSPGNEAYILLKKAPEEGIEMLVRVSAFECESYNATPCSRSNHCYLEDEICDGTVQCERSGEDEQGCGSPAPDPCHYCERYGTDDTCLPQQWLCDDYADCIDGSDESDCGTATDPPCYQCPSEPDCINLSYICDGVDDCLDGSDEVNCTICFECPSGSLYDCVFDPNWVCDGFDDCNDGEDEIDCPDVCTGFVCETFFGNCLLEMYVCDGMPDCSDGTDELNCNVTEPPCFQCPSEPDCINLSYVCDGVDDCLDGSDEVNCTCPDDQYPCFFDDSICLDYTDVGCDGNYDCPGGTDEYNCTGCFACPGLSSCLFDLQVCNYYSDCPDGEDETEDLCKHSEYISNFDIQVGVWTYFSEGFVRERTLDDRDTPASEFYDFTHYVFESPVGSTLFMEILNFTMNLTGPLLDLVGVSTGYWTNPTYFETVLAFADGNGYLESYTSSTNFTLFFNTGYLLIAMPKSVAGIFNMTFRVSAVECDSPESPCYLSLHCLNMVKDYCDGEVQCLDSEEDEYGCEATEPPCFQCPSQPDCINASYVCDGVNNCEDGSDEVNCNCFACEEYRDVDGCIPLAFVCDDDIDCYDGTDEEDCEGE
nr:low-density lipoprotein receptor-related protein 2-like [Lytechinus pictus]